MIRAVRKQRGFGYVELIIGAAVLGLAVTAILTYNRAIIRAEQAENRAEAERMARVQTEAELEAEKIIQNAKIEAQDIAHKAQTRNLIDAERRKAEANASQISETSQRDAEKYTGFVRRVMPKNFELLKCKTSFNARADRDCIGRVR